MKTLFECKQGVFMKNLGATIVIASTLLTFIACGKNGTKNSPSADGQTTADKMSPSEEKNKDEISSGGQPGFAQLSGAVVSNAAKGLEEGLDQRLQIKQEGGMGWRGEKAAIKVKSYVTNQNLSDADDKILDAINSKDFINLGCDSKSINPGELTEKKIDGSADATTAKPDATTAKPDATTAKPDATTAKPDATTAKPDATTAKPDATTAKPDATTAKPDATTAKPDATTAIKEISATETADKREKSQLDKNILDLTANSIFVCDGKLLDASNVSLKAKIIYLTDLALTKISSGTSSLELITEDLALEGNTVISLLGEDGPQTITTAPSLVLSAKRVSGAGKLSIKMTGANYKKDAANPEDKDKQNAENDKKSKNIKANENSNTSGAGATMQNPT
jgi:predicted small lipoprotein YifL